MKKAITTVVAVVFVSFVFIFGFLATREKTASPTSASVWIPANPPGIPATQSPLPAPPDRIIFESDRSGNFEIYAMNADGSGQTALTDNPGDDVLPAWSPDGKTIAFVSNRDGNRGLYLMDPDGSGQKLLTANIYQVGPEYSWSPDGARIAYRAGKDVYLINSDGSGDRNISNSPADYFGLSWSPDGKRIAFMSSRTNVNWVWVDIYSINSDGNDLLNLTNYQGGRTFSDWPAWSPVDMRIAFMYNVDGQWDIYAMDPDGTGKTNLSNNPAREGLFSWSPDGTRIAFVSDRAGSDLYYVMNSDGSDQRKLTDLQDDNMGFSWSPDGTRLVFVSNNAGNDEIYAINADGSGLLRLTENSANDIRPSWQP
jgi:Tol biopolymer transport system component